MLQGFGYLGLHRLDRNPHFPGNFLISLPFLPTFAINLPTFVRKGTNSFFNQSVQFFHLHRSISSKSISSHKFIKMERASSSISCLSLR